MFSDLYPHFQKGRILKKEMLENLRDYPRQLIDIQLQEYSDGVVAGCQLGVEENQLIIGRGMVKHQGRIYLLTEEYHLPYQARGEETLVKINFKPEKRVSDFTSYETEIMLADDVQIKEHELELGRFKLKVGARLRNDYQSFADLATEYNTVNLLHVPYAGLGKSTLHPTILRFFAHELLQSGSSNPLDILFAMQCLNQASINRDLLLHYLANRLGTGYKEYANVQLHKALGRIILEVQGGGRARMEASYGRPQRMIVD